MINGGISAGQVMSPDDDDEMKNLNELIKKNPIVPATKIANDVLQETGKRVNDLTIRRYRRALGYRHYHQTLKKSFTSTQKESKIFFSQHYMNSNITHWLFCDDKVFTLQSTGTID
ncbi:unnamed protein product [Rotaria magnacalcarata]|uniref:Transposase Tc1-like domain-containing protein n=3 Tax=Rotaria magnacalcarata TaxID=392030 RepID=A0A816XMT1_9BILA|nr:unnamed protein product [Rotaria magnacalcarata]CAF2139776.1 unnamed protein product [Rotaria magnacalcarata]CAF2148830.1 unnamed protein product [Rotaria magnacalcarata]CAF3806082.1 unnamed protein product [Rotaria magnacalcarata]CAF4039780.1 unnamed protein product [Rotaria magnacalcarata]